MSFWHTFQHPLPHTAAAAAEDEMIQGLDVSKHGERAMAINGIQLHVDALNSSKHGSPVTGSEV
jgi:hypothetical protein